MSKEVAFLAAAAGLVGAAWYAFDHQPTAEQAAEQREPAIAKELTLRALKAPATAKFVATRTIERLGADRLVQVQVDAQNGFGALVRNNLCVTFTMGAGGRYTFRSGAYAQECSNPPTPTELELIKDANLWGKPKGVAADDTSL